MLLRYKGHSSIVAAALLALLLSLMMPGRAEACACCGTYGVINVAANDELNIREAADPNSRWVGAIPSGHCGIDRTGPEARSPNGAWWVEIVYGGVTGWVNKRYINWIP